MFGVFDCYNNRMFDCKSFKSFDDAWEYIDTMFPDEVDINLEALPLNPLNYGYNKE